MVRIGGGIGETVAIGASGIGRIGEGVAILVGAPVGEGIKS